MGFWVHIQRDRLVGYFFQTIDDGRCLDGEHAVTVSLIHIECGHQCGLAIGSREAELAILKLKEDAIQNLNGILAGKNPTQGLQTVAERCA